MKYDKNSNLCIPIEDCDLTRMNAYYCMEENTPLACETGQYIDFDGIVSSGNRVTTLGDAINIYLSDISLKSLKIAKKNAFKKIDENLISKRSRALERFLNGIVILNVVPLFTTLSTYG